jgi:chromosome segregation ATPase
MRMIACVVVVSLGLVGCGSPDCKTAADKAIAATHPKDKEMVPMLVRACEKDGWSGEVRTCLASVKSDADAEACMAKLDGSELLKAKRDAEEARLRAMVAEQQAAQAMADSKAARDQLTAVQTKLGELDAHVSAAVDAVAAAQTQTDRDALVAKLASLQREKAELEAKMAEAKASAARAERMKGVHISKECLDNPLAKGCS